MRIVKPDPPLRTASEAEQLDLIDVLHDAVDEYDAGNCPLSTFAYEVGAIIISLDVGADPAWFAALGEEWVKLCVLRAELRQTTTIEPTRAQSAAGQAIADRIRQLIATWDNAAVETEAANFRTYPT